MPAKVFEFALCLIEVFSIYFIMYRLFPSRLTHRAIIWLAAFFNSSFLYLPPAFDYLKAICSVLSITFLTFFVFRIRIYVASLFSLMSIYIFCILDVIIRNLLSVIKYESITAIMYDSFPHCLIIGLSVKLLDFLALLYIWQQFRDIDTDLLEKKSWLLSNFVMSMFLIITTMSITFYSANTTSTHTKLPYLVLAVLFFVMSLIVIHFLAYILKISRSKQKLTLLEACYEAAEENLALQRSGVEKMNRVRHDIKNHLGLAHTLLKQSRYDDADRIITEALAQTDNISLSLDNSSGNSIIDAIIFSKVAKCTELGITFEYCLDLLPDISIDVLDLSSLLSNMLDNALEAAKTTPDPYIILKIFFLENHLNISIKNSFSGDLITECETGRLVSSKENNNGTPHGYGTLIIKEIATKYSGSFDWNAKNGFFNANVFLVIQ